MSRTVDIGIVVRAEDQASRVLRGMGRGFTTLRSAIQGVGERGASVFSALGKGIVVFNQGLEIAKKGVDIFKAVMSPLLETTLAQRAETDLQKKAWKQYGNELKVVAGLIGDVVLPVILGIADAFSPSIKASKSYLKVNKELIGSGLVDFLAKTASLLTTGVAKSILVVSKTWSGWKLVISGTKSLVATMFGDMSTQIDGILGQIQKVAEAFGRDGLSARIIQARKSVREFGSSFQDSADQATAAAAQEIAAQDALEKRVKEVQKAIQQGIGVASVKAMKRLGQSIKKVPPNLEEIKAKLEKLKAKAKEFGDAASARIGSFVGRFTQGFELAAAAAERNGQLLDALEAQSQEKAANIANFVSGNLLTAFEDIASGTKSVTGAFADMFKQLVIMAAKNAFVFALLNVFTGGTAGAGLGAAGVLGKVFGFHDGGLVMANSGLIVGGSSLDKDIVPALLTPGERVLNRTETRNLDAGIPPSRSDGTPVSTGSRSANITINTGLFGAPTPAQTDRWFRDNVTPSMRRLARNGLI